MNTRIKLPQFLIFSFAFGLSLTNILPASSINADQSSHQEQLGISALYSSVPVNTINQAMATPTSGAAPAVLSESVQPHTYLPIVAQWYSGSLTAPQRPIIRPPKKTSTPTATQKSASPTPTKTVVPTQTSVPTVLPTKIPATSTPLPTNTPTQVVPTNTPLPTSTATPENTATPTEVPTATPEPPTSTPEPLPTETPVPTVPVSTEVPTPQPTPTDPPISPANTFFVATDGNDANPGTQSQPWRTIQKAASMLTAGQTVMVRGGVYNEKVTPANSGIPGQYITYMAFPGETPVIDGTGIYLNLSDYRRDGLIQVIGKKYLKFSGLTIRNSAYECVNLYKYDQNSQNDYSEYITLSGLNIQNCTWVGIMVRYARHIVVADNSINKIDYSSGIGIWKSEDVVVDNNTITDAHYYHEKQGAYEEVISMSSVISFEVKNNKLDNTLPVPWDTNDLSYYRDRIGIDVKDSSQYGKVYKNTVKNMTAAGLYVDSYYAGTFYNGSLRPTLQHIDLFQNTTIDGGGIVVGAELYDGIVEYVNIYNNLVINSTFAGIQVKKAHGDGLRKNIAVYNNVIFGANPAGGHGGAGIAVTTEHLGTNDGNKPVIIQNNISMFYFPSGTTYVSQIRAGNANIASMILASNNIVYGPQYCSTEYPNCVEVGTRITAAPATVFINSSALDFHLKSGSPAIDTGVNVGLFNFDLEGLLRPRGNWFDIGVYEAQ